MARAHLRTGAHPDPRAARRRSVAKDLRAIPKADVARILVRIRALVDDPRPPGCEMLAGRDCFRVRQGRYRMVYEIRDACLLVIVIRVAHRRDAYRK